MQNLLNGLTMHWGIGEYGSDEHVGTPLGVADAFATPEVQYVDAQIPESVISLEHGEVGVVGVKLQVSRGGRERVWDKK